MISIVLYGRNDAYGYNLHKRAALGLNCMAEILSHPADEILFVDYNTPDDHPTFPEAIADTLTPTAVARLRVLRVRPAIHDRVKARTHLKAIEPVARNVAVRRSNPANRWILSTNTDMILVPRVPGGSLSDIVSDLPRGFYHVPRFEIPESMWEGFDRGNPACVIDRVRTLGRTRFLNEIVYGVEFIKYDAPGDFQLIARDDLFRIHGFNEDMLLGWHVDSNIAKRLHLLYGSVGDLVERVFGYHCDHTRQVTPAHQHVSIGNDWGLFVDQVTEPGLPGQAGSWGCAADEIEEIVLSRSAHHVYMEGLGSVLSGEWSEPSTVRFTPDAFDQAGYDPRHVLPFLADLFSSAPRGWTVAWIGGRRDMFQMFCDVWERMGCAGELLIDDWSVPLLCADPRGFVRSADCAAIMAKADVLIFDFGVPSQSPGTIETLGVDPAWVDTLVDRLSYRRLVVIAEHERARVAKGTPPRRLICINAVYNRHEALVRREIGAAATPFATRLRHGFVVPRGVAQLPPDRQTAPPGDAAAAAELLERLGVDAGGRRTAAGIVAPFGQRGYVLRGMPYERLLPGEYELEISIQPRTLLALAALIRPVIVEVVVRDRYLAREYMSFLLRGRRRLRFPIPDDRREGLTGVEIRLFRGRFADFVVTGVQLWRLPELPDAIEGFENETARALLRAFKLSGSTEAHSHERNL